MRTSHSSTTTAREVVSPRAAAPHPLQHADGARRAEMQCGLARVWRRQGKLDRAVRSYQKALDLDQACTTAYGELGGLLREQGHLDEAIRVLEDGLEVTPHAAELHKALTDALIERGGLAAAYAHYHLEREDAGVVTIVPDDVLCCMIVRNEALRLPYLLSHYRRQGVARFLVIDNDSTDDTLPYLLAQPDVYLWRSTCSFSRANFGAGPFEVLLREHGIGHWCLIVDADELLVYPGCEHRGLLELCAELDRQGKRALGAVLLDMYSDRPIEDTHYVAGQAFVDVCPYFDRQFYHARYERWNPYRNQTCLFGGMRQRVFGEQGAYNISKVPLIKYDLDCVLIGGQHWTNRPRAEIATQTGCLLHFKYFATFPAYVRGEVARKEHYDGGMQYAQYARGLAEHERLTLYDAQRSIRYTDSQQLVSLGIMQPDVAPSGPARRP